MSELLHPARRGDLVTIKRLAASGARLCERGPTGRTALITASEYGRLAVVKYLLTQGASITEKDDFVDFTALLAAAAGYKYVVVQYCLEEAGASITEATNTGDTVWDFLRPEGPESDEFTSLLKVMVMLDDAPPAFVAILTPVHAAITERGLHYRAHLSSYLEQQHALIVKHCLLPVVLLPLVTAYAATTSEDMWTDGLRVRAL
jgi:ankyrin repeat protein